MMPPPPTMTLPTLCVPMPAATCKERLRLSETLLGVFDRQVPCLSELSLEFTLPRRGHKKSEALGSATFHAYHDLVPHSVKPIM